MKRVVMLNEVKHLSERHCDALNMTAPRVIAQRIGLHSTL
jgi:hypothetical protein